MMMRLLLLIALIMQAAPMTIEHARPFQGDAESAFAEARRVLDALSFRVEHADTRTVRAVGPGLLSSRQPALNFAKRIEVELRPGHLFVRADQAALDRLLRILLWTPVGIALVVLAILVAIFWAKGVAIPWTLVLLPAVGGPLLISLIQRPIFRRVFGRRARQAVGEFADHLVQVGERAAS